MPKQKHDYDLIVLGGGAGGTVAAHISASSGKKVALIEPGDVGGNCSNWGLIPAGALINAANIYDTARRSERFGIRSSALSYNYPSLKAWRDLVVKRTGAGQTKRILEAQGIQVISGEARFVDPHTVSVNRQQLSADKFLIATGSHDFLPPIEGLDKVPFLTYKEASQLSRPPKSTFIIGSTPTACEYASLFSTFGTKIIISDIAPRLLMNEDEEASDLLQKVLHDERGVTTLLNTKVHRVSKEGLSKRVQFQQGHEIKSVKVDEVFIANGRLANVQLDLEKAGVKYTPQGIKVNSHLQTSTKHIYAAGSVTGISQFPNIAVYQSRLAGYNLWSKQQIEADYSAAPHIVLTNPEIASVGVSENDCVKRDLKYKKALVPLTLAARANITNTQHGFVKVLTKANGTLIGATIAGPAAGEMIHELTLAIQYELTAQEVAQTIHAFPSWNEAVRIACNKVR